VITIFFITDIILTFRTTYYDDDGNEILDPKLIRNSYFKSTVFWIDTVSAVPISELYDGENKNILRILSVIKMIRLMRIGRILKLLKSSDLKLFSKLA
jgi:Ion transport protein